MEKYFTAKTHVALYQSENDVFYVGDNVPEFNTKARKTVISSKEKYNYELSINGEHNKYNAEFVYRIASEQFGCDSNKIKEALKTFKGLAHRLELVGCVNGVEYYDDSISTIPQATISAATSLKHAKTLLIGGMDRGIDYTVLEEFINEHKEYNYILMYETGRRIMEGLTDKTNVYYSENLEGAVELAKQLTHSREACILSPAAASYGYFKNFEERGDVFKQLVNE